MRALTSSSLAVALVALVAAQPVVAAPQPKLVKRVQLDPRLQELTFTTPALAAPTNVRVLLPTGYDRSGRTRYPVLYLLHGGLDDYRSWTDKGDAEAITKGVPLIVVMPDAGQFGNYTDWYNAGAFGPPAWETWHLRQLLPWVDSHYPTIAKRSGRATAGLSMGGFGTMSYAARHPDMFVSASSFSGAVDTNSLGVELLVESSGLSDGSQRPGAIFGPRATEEVRWRAHNPWDLAENLKGLKLTLRTGNGAPGGPGGDSGDPIEAEVHNESLSLHNRLAELRIPHVWDDYGAGGHQWYYWRRDLRRTLPGLMKTFAHPPASPARFNFRAVEPNYSVFGWHVSLKRTALEFSELRGASRRGFELRGSGTATVRTARYFKPRSIVRATFGTATSKLRAGRSGRLTLHVPLGPANPYQQYSPQARAAGTKVFSAKVKLRGSR